MSPLSYSIFVFRWLGLWHSNDWLSGWKVKLYIGYTACIFALMYSFTLSQFIMLYGCIGNTNEFTDASFMLLSMMAICGKMVNMIIKRKAVVDIVRTMETDPFNPQDSEEQVIISKLTETIKLYTLLYGFLTEATVTMLTVVSVVQDVPNRALPFKAWLPFSLSTPTMYWIAYIHQTLGHYVAANINIGFDSLVPGMMMIVCAQLKILKHRFHKIQQTVNGTCNSATLNNNHIKELINLENKLIADCTKHHIAIFQFAQLSNDTFVVSIFLQFCASSLVLCFSIFSLAHSKPFSREFTYMIMYLMCMLIQIFVFCRYATEVSLESESVNDAIYAMEWTSLTTNTKKSLVLVMARTLRPINYTSCHITLSLVSFSSLLKLSYSTYNILQHSSQ